MSAGQRSWIEKRIETLTESSDKVFDVRPDIYNSFNTWSALKLILHSATVNMYTTVASDHFDDLFYIDALAGSGVSEYGDEQCFLGSPIIAAKAATEPFTKMYFVEGDLKKKRALEERLEFAFDNPDIDLQKPQDYEVYQGDVNEKIGDIISDVWEVAGPNYNFNYLGFIDNQGLDFNWESMEEIGELTGDLLVNYPAAQGVGLNFNIGESRDAMKTFFGKDMWDEEPKEREHYKEVYMKRMEEQLDLAEQVSVKVDSGFKSYYYDMIYGTRETAGGSGYVDAIRHVKDFIEAVDGGTVEEILEVLHGDQAAVDEFLPDDFDIDSSVMENEDVQHEQEDQSQTGLDEFL